MSFIFTLRIIACLFVVGWVIGKFSSKVKFEYPNSLSSFGVFFPVVFFPKRLIILIVEPAWLYLVYIV